MLKQLLKKQLLEMFQNFFVDRKKNKGRSKSSSIMMIVGYAVLIVGIFGGMFSFFARSLLPLVSRSSTVSPLDSLSGTYLALSRIG